MQSKLHAVREDPTVRLRSDGSNVKQLYNQINFFYIWTI
jgi:hypothetical protein